MRRDDLAFLDVHIKQNKKDLVEHIRSDIKALPSYCVKYKTGEIDYHISLSKVMEILDKHEAKL